MCCTYSFIDYFQYLPVPAKGVWTVGHDDLGWNELRDKYDVIEKFEAGKYYFSWVGITEPLVAEYPGKQTHHSVVCNIWWQVLSLFMPSMCVIKSYVCVGTMD